MIELNEKIVGIWFLVTTPEQDWMAALTEIEPNAKYELTYRFRYYSPESENPWDGKDKKNWYKGTITQTKEEALEGVRTVGRAMAAMGAVGEVDEVLNHGDYAEFLERFTARPWVFAKVNDGEAEPEPKQDDFDKFMRSIGATKEVDGA